MHHAFLPRLFNRRAESLIETLVAITVIVIATTAALSVMRTALAGNQVIEKKVVALNLAEETFEVLRNIRDTNYLLYASDPDNCWNKINISDVSQCSSASKAIQEGTTYYLSRNFSSDPYFQWTLRTGSTGYLTLYDVDLDSDGDGDGDSDSIGDTQMYAQPSVSHASFTANTVRVFNRTLTVEYNSAGDAYDATVVVEWTDGDLTKSVELTKTIRHIY